MFNTSTILWGLLWGISLSIVLGFPFFVYWLAERYNLFFTIVEEGTAKLVVRGGNLERVLLAYDGFYLNPKWEVIKETDETEDARGFFERTIGLYWVGIPPFYSVYEYTFEWMEQQQTSDKGYVAKNRKERTDFIYVKDFAYFIMLMGVETKGKIPVDLRYLLTVRIVNPYSALFKIEEWLRRTEGACNRVARNYVGSISIEQLTSEIDRKSDDRAVSKADAFSEHIMELSEKIPSQDDGLEFLYGVEIVSVDLQSFELSGKLGEATRAATTRLYVAEQEAEAIKMLATAEKERIDTVYGALESHKDISMLVRQFEAMEKSGQSGNTIVWANNPLLEAVEKFSKSQGDN